MNRKTLLITILCVGGFTAIYLYYVKKERQASIIHYFPHPVVGDIYKMQKTTYEDGTIVFFLKIKDIGTESIYFYPSRMVSGAISDVLLSSFDTTETEVFTKKELAEIVAGKWLEKAGKQETQLLEIERK